MPWRIELLGRLRVAHGGRDVTSFLTQQVATLLAYLALTHSVGRQASHPREMLTRLLWPEDDPEVGRTNLRALLLRLRRQIEGAGGDVGSLLIIGRSAVELHPGVVTDVAEFTGAIEAAARAGNPGTRAQCLAAAVSLYQGELLSGVCEPWALADRQRLAALHLQTLQQLAAAREQSGDLTGAIEAAQWAVNADPLREEAHYVLMRLYAAAGQPSATLKQYQELERILQKELGEAPSAATQALVTELREAAGDTMRARGLADHAPPRPVGAEEAERRTPARALAPRSEEEQAETSPAPPSGPAGPGIPVPSPLPLREGPPPTSSPARLPVQFTRFFGREEEIASLTATLRVPETRLVALTGPGGSGKTRLAIAVAGRLREEFDGAVWFVPLAEVAEARRIGDAIRDAMLLPPSSEGEPMEQVAAALAAAPSLLVLDNFEQLVGEGSLMVRSLLERLPRLTCLVTSRHRLNLAGEQEFPVRPLPTPDEGVGWGVGGGAPTPTPPPPPPTPHRPTPSSRSRACSSSWTGRGRCGRSSR